MAFRKYSFIEVPSCTLKATFNDKDNVVMLLFVGPPPFFLILHSKDIFPKFGIYFLIDIHSSSVVPKTSCIVTRSIFNKRMTQNNGCSSTAANHFNVLGQNLSDISLPKILVSNERNFYA